MQTLLAALSAQAVLASVGQLSAVAQLLSVM
ncbi:hypothetical protein P608_20465 [Comamonas thiooxydans]|uniref:Uncharacterized protein n=1 Tax=Comamonas thiooxydans TaxID=363952 RepID=D8D702_9BURK|nr:hypothetical protein CTS44_12914 [Comamonas thiooxydans]KGG82655.1 hypothetical protein P609_20180 [Comamonas thiooxydans]KGG94390.1 hypothetical protein P369_06025 [Comamonas thiooxydans]KGH00226.1 hypothetical protein P367_07035 [Comamonas thiooxydans]KGH07496.1 hypothetical protein P608_20465 [Comamonas thiooxydans]